MKSLIALLTVVFLVGCSSTSQYYEAVEKAAKANAEAQSARYNALASIANSGSGEAATAAVMALAMTQAPVVTPQAVPSAALQWTQALASPLSSLGMMYMQVDSTKALARYNRDVNVAQVMASSSDNQALYNVFGGITDSMATSNAAGLQAVTSVVNGVDYSPFVDAIVNVAGQGFNTATVLGTAGIDGVVDVSNTSQNTIRSIVSENTRTLEALANGRVVCSNVTDPVSGAITLNCD
jgi:hypothetical protein